ncbi:unnamed protein product, partial [Phaeothamnion confervicola]
MAERPETRISEQIAEAFKSRGLRVEARDGRGRCVIAERAFKSGEIVFCNLPFAVALHESQWSHRCNACFQRQSSELKRCSRCRAHFYCDKRCQQVAWRAGHRDECARLPALLAALAAKGGYAGAANALLLGRVEALRRAVGDGGDSGSSLPAASRRGAPIASTAADVDAMVSPLPSARRIDDDNDGMASLAAAAVASGLFSGSGGSANGGSGGTSSGAGDSAGGESSAETPAAAAAAAVAEATTLLGRFACNNFGVLDGLMVSVAAGIYPAAALLNHSCAPNCVLSWEPRTAVLVVRTAAPVTPGEELCHAFVDAAAPTAARRMALQESYGFRCDCRRC